MPSHDELRRHRPLLRLVLAVSLDGRIAPPAGGAAQIGGRGDRRALEESLAWADASLIGAETLRRHGSTCLIHDADLLQKRTTQGLAPQPIAIAVSRGGDLPARLPFFRQPLERWLLLGSPAPQADPATARSADFLRQEPLPCWAEALERLAAAGLGRIVVLGGAALAAGLLAEGFIDELQLTLCPLLLGGPHAWLPTWTQVPESLRTGWEPVEQRLLGDGELLLRYRRPAGSV